VPALAAREQGSPSHGVGRFVATHEDCGAGFEITRNGRGRLYLVCGACGERTQYGAEDAEQLRAHGVDPAPAATARRFQPRLENVARRENVERWLPAPAALPWWVPNAYIVAVILIGLGLIGFGVLRPGSDDPAIFGGGADQEEQSPPPSESPPAGDQATPAPAPTPTPTPAPQAPVTAGAAPSPAAPKPAPARRPARPELDRIEVAGRFAIGVPEGWERGMSGGTVVFEAPGSTVVLRVFLEAGGVKPGSLADEARRFLRQSHAGGKVSKPQPTKLGGFRAVELLCTYPGGKERATLLSARGYSYLVLTEVEGDAPASARRASVAALRSFRPL
jgi:hypothetical protein